MLVMSGAEHSWARMIEGSRVSLGGAGLPWIGGVGVGRGGCFAAAGPADGEGLVAVARGAGVLDHVHAGWCLRPWLLSRVALRDERFTPSRPWPGMLDGVPQPLRAIAERVIYDESFGANATVTLWRLADDAAWSYGRLWAGMRQSSMQ